MVFFSFTSPERDEIIKEMRTSERPYLDLFAGAPLFLGAAFIPWAQGGNHHSVPTLFSCTIGLGVIIWIYGLIIRQRLPKLPRLWYPCFTLIMVAGLSNLNSGNLPSNQFILDHQTAVAERWPGAWIVESGRTWLIISGISLLSLAAGTDLLRRHPEWMRPVSILLLVGASGVSLSGLFAGGAADWMFRDSIDLPGRPFAGFFDDSMAGAYLNLIWPLGFALAIGSAKKHGPAAAKDGRYLAALMALFTFAGIWTLPTAAAKGLSLFLLAFLLLAWAESRNRGFRNFWTRACRRYGKAWTSLGLLAALALIAALIGFTVVRPTLKNWGVVTATGPSTPLEEPLQDRGDLMLPSTDPRRTLPEFHRRLAWSTALSMLPDTQWFGAGPRAWKATYPEYTDDLSILSFFLHIQFVQNDSLQYLIEWGWLGGGAWITLWLLLLWTGLVCLWKRLQGLSTWTSRDQIAFAAWLSIGSCLVHAQVAFPLQSAGILAPAMVCGALVLADPSRKRRRTPRKPEQTDYEIIERS